MVSDQASVLFWILSLSCAFGILSLILTLWMIKRRIKKNREQSSEKLLISKYQDFLSDFLILPIDESFIGLMKEEQLSNRLDRSDLMDPKKRSLLATEMYYLTTQLDGQQAKQMINYFFGLGMQEDILDMIEDKDFTICARGLQFVRVFKIREALPVVNQLVNHKNLELSILAIIARIVFDDNISVLTELPRCLTAWEWHKLLVEFKNMSIPESAFKRLKLGGVQNGEFIKIVEENLFATHAFKNVQNIASC